jgi:hypothetical protein
VSDAGNANGDVLDDPVVNSAVVGVDALSGDGNDPGNPPTGDDEATESSSGKRASGDRRRA